VLRERDGGDEDAGEREGCDDNEAGNIGMRYGVPRDGDRAIHTYFRCLLFEVINLVSSGASGKEPGCGR
jgi:hypothetical protein